MRSAKGARATSEHAQERRFGTDPASRTVEELLQTGIVIVDKPSGPTSHQVTAWVSRMLGGVKAGHAGTLDPAVTGVLPIGTGISVRALDALHYLPKEYVGVMRFHGDIDAGEVQSLFAEFTGKIYQMPPVRSAVKRERRVREIYSLRLLESEGRMFLFHAVCEAGTYIRTLCRDIGEASCRGGQLVELRRTRSGPFGEESCITLQQLEDALYYHRNGDSSRLLSCVRPFEELLRAFPSIVLKESAVDSICHGANLSVRGIEKVHGSIKRGSIVSLVTGRGEGVALATSLMSRELMENAASGVACDTMRVFMKPGTYPKFRKQS